MFAKKTNGAIAGTLLLAIALWGGSNAGTKFLVTSQPAWPPIWVGGTRFLCAGLLMLALLRWTNWLGPSTPPPEDARRGLWLRGGLSLAVYIVAFNWALHYTTASHVALYLGAAPVWALVWDERPSLTWRSAQRYGAAALAVAGVIVLFWPTLKSGAAHWIGDLLALAASFLWTNYSRQCRVFGAKLSGAEISAHTLWRAGLLLLPFALVEVAARGLAWRADLFWVQIYCILAGGVVSYAIWNNALRHWPTSRVFLFNNLIPLSTMTWARFCLNEPVTPTFWFAMALIVAGVVLGQLGWQKFLKGRGAGNAGLAAVEGEG